MNEKCIVKGCENKRGQGTFVNDLCAPCFNMLVTGQASLGQTWVHDLAYKYDELLEKTKMTYEELWHTCFNIIKNRERSIQKNSAQDIHGYACSAFSPTAFKFSTDGVVHHVGRRYVEASGDYTLSNELLLNLGIAWAKLRPEGQRGCIGDGLTHEQIIQMWQIAKEMGP
jgi:hypothetical protein